MMRSLRRVMRRGHRGAGPGGTAHFATPWTLRRRGRLSQRDGLYVGTVRGLLARYPVLVPDNHSISGILLTAPPNAGKTTCVVIPQVLSEAGLGRTVVVNDPKLEILQKTVPLLSLTHRIAVWAPLYTPLYAASFGGIARRFDPLRHVRSAEDARALARGIIDATGRSSQQPFHDRLEEDLIAAALLSCAFTHPGASIQDVRRFLLRATLEDMIAAFGAYALRHGDEIVSDIVGTLRRLAASPETQGDVLAGLGGRFGALASPGVIETTSGDDLDLAALLAQPTVLYVSIPLEDSGKGTLRPLINAFYTLLLRELQEAAAGCPLPRPVHIYLEEAANIGKLDDLATMVRTLRSMDVWIALIIQSFNDLVTLYGKDEAEAIRGACTVQLTLAGAAQDDAEYFSRRAGDTTVEVDQPTRRGGGLGGLVPSRVQSRTTGPMKRALIMPDEVVRLRGKGLLLENGEDPVRTDLPPYYRNRPLGRALDAARASLPRRDPALAALLARVARGGLKGHSLAGARQPAADRLPLPQPEALVQPAAEAALPAPHPEPERRYRRPATRPLPAEE